MAMAFISGFSVLEWLLVGFIGANAAVSCVYMVHRGLERLSAHRGE